MTMIAPTLQAFFSDRLAKQLNASASTIESYRDTLSLLLRFVQDTTGKPPSALDWEELDEPVIAAFLEHLETERGNSARTRNLRFTAIRSLFQYAAVRHPEHAAVIGRVLSIPPKRFQRRAVTFLTAEECKAVIDAAPLGRREGRRDRAMLTLTIQSGLRVSELVAVNCGDVTLGTGGCVCVEGKGRKHRAVPLTKEARAVSPSGSKSGAAHSKIRCSRHAQAADSVAMPSSAASRFMSRPRPSDACRSKANESIPTFSGTAAQWRCCTPASTAPSSRCGSGTRMSVRPSPTSTPT